MHNLIQFSVVTLVFMLLGCSSESEQAVSINQYQDGIAKMRYNNSYLKVDLDVGFKSVPMPLDFDGDGDYDLLVSASGSYVESGIYYFENISGQVEMPVFRHGERLSTERFRLGYDGKFFEVSNVNGRVHILSPDRTNDELVIYSDVPENVFWDRNNYGISIKSTMPGIGDNTWKIIDFDGDEVHDLLCGLSTKQGHYLLFYKNIGSDTEPKYAEAEKILTEDGQPIGSDLNLEVALADYDGDGDLDYVVITPFAQIMYYQNTGSQEFYQFAKGQKLNLQGDDIQLYTKYGGATKLRSVDWDGDGWNDIIAGDEEGKVSLIKHTGKVVDGMPQFLQPRFFQQQAKYLDLGALVAPRVFDWDGDGLDDIVTGNGAGDVLFVRNLGGSIPTWDRPESVQSNGEDVRIIPTEALPNTEDPHWGYTTLDVGDWDGDHLPDLLVNEHNGNIVFLKNIGTRTQPNMAKPVPLEVEWKGEVQKPAWTPGVSQGNELLAPWRTSPFMMDFNEDGLTDLVMLDYEGYLVVFPRFKEGEDLKLGHPERNFISPDGQPILLNQRTGSSHGRLKITFADWGGDGLEDLVFSSKPAVDWMKNKGMKDGKMVLEYMGRVVSQTLMGHTDGPVVSDFNKDGILDLLIGTETGVIYYWERMNNEVTSTMTSTVPQKSASYPYFKR